MLRQLDLHLLSLINKTLSCPTLDAFMPLLNLIGTREFLFLLAAILALQGRQARWTALMLAAGLLVKDACGDSLKSIFGRPRPFEVLTGINQLMQASGSAFPSGHTTTAFLIQTLLQPLVKGWKNKALLAVLALSAGFARVYVGVHWPSDVAGGIVLGTVLGCALLGLRNWCLRRLGPEQGKR